MRKRHWQADRAFKVEDIEQVHKIFIADRRGERTTLERRDGYWLYNRQYKSPSVMRTARRHLPGAGQIQTASGGSAVYGGSAGDRRHQSGAVRSGRSPIKAYYVGGSTSDERGTYMIMDGFAEQPMAELPSGRAT